MSAQNYEFRKTLRGRSVVLVVPREKFKNWAKEMSIHDPTAAPHRPICAFEENSAWLIPNEGRFPGHEAFQKYLEDLKPSLLAMEVRSIYKGAENFSEPMTKSTFDDYFELKIVDTIVEIDELFGK